MIPGIILSCFPKPFVSQPSLLEICLDGLSCVTDVGLQSLATVCSELEVLSLSDCEEVSDQGMRFLALRCRRLRKISLANTSTSDEGAAVLGTFCGMLEYINMDGCIGISDRGLAALMSGCHINTLSLAGTKVVLESAMFEKSMTNHWRDLTKINLSRCKISDGALGRLSLVAPALLHLDLTWCEKLTDQGLAFLCGYHARSCPLPFPVLSSSDSSSSFSTSSSASSSSFSPWLFQTQPSSAEGCLHLRTLVLTQCKALTDLALRHIGTRLRLLERLELKGCHQLTQNGVAHLLHCSVLRYLDLRGCYEVSSQALIGFPQGATLLFSP
eukprot:gb/GEZN01008097.1/.p1 GENE.gb/GEZN01008097.1/~~gb/GEZN01008097.1/.p1  ORF type:complete len:328 (+),score=16.99 gb/GEZN01008097.1/:397-1380(+)